MKPCLAALALLAAVPMTTHGADVRAIFSVSATVPARANLETISQPTALAVSGEDVALGYVDVAAVYRVRNNDPAGYLLQFMPVAGIARQVQVRGLGCALVLGEDAVEVHRPGDSFEQDVALEFRFVLEQGARPGTFNWPVRLTAQPI